MTDSIVKVVAARRATVRVPRVARVPVSEANLRRAAIRLLATPLVSTEVYYIQRELGTTATQDEVDAKVLATRKAPWASIVEPE